MNYSIIIPFFNEEKNITSLISEIMALTKKNNDKIFEIILVDDGSTDKTFEVLLGLKEKYSFKIIRHKYNLSQSKAIYSGIKNSKYDNLIFLDGDCQNDPHDLNEMIKNYEQGYDLVHGYRINRKDKFLSKVLPSKLANFLVRFITGSHIKDHGCSIKILKKKLLGDEILWGDFHRLLAARLDFKNLKFIQIPTNHRKRNHGISNYGFYRVFKVFVDLIYLRLFQNKKNNNFYFIGILGFCSFLTGLILLIYMFYLKFFENISFIATPLPILIVSLFLSSLIFFSLLFIIQLMFEISKKNEKNTYYDLIE
tara:strand:- start:352 stop:1281 length:930 start_codon:yes stop_codon:yes gene_type:complete